MNTTREDGTINSTTVGAVVTKTYNQQSPTVKGEGLQSSVVHRLLRIMRLFLQDEYTNEQVLEWVNRQI